MIRCVAIACCLYMTPVCSAQVFHKVILDSDKNIPLERFAADSKTVTPDCKIPWSIRHTRLHGGKQEGCDLLHLDNGKLKLTIVPTRGMGILHASLGDIRLGWDSPVKEVVHPKFINLQARGGLGWLDGFNEFMVRCGLENNGQAGKDEFINNMGDKAVMELTLHGKIANIPASEVEVVVEKQPPFRIHIRGVVHERMFFGPKLELRTEISTVPGTSRFTVTDVVTNRGARPEEFQMLYHANFGKPLLEEGAKFLAPLERVTPFNANAAKDVDRWNQFTGPTLGYVEQVYMLKPRTDHQGTTIILLHNKAGDKGASMAYSLKDLPYLTLWKNTAAEADGYVTGLEPATNYPNSRQTERKYGRVPKLGPAESRSMWVTYAIHAGAEEVKSVVEAIRAVQAGTAPIIDRDPPKK